MTHTIDNWNNIDLENPEHNNCVGLVHNHPEGVTDQKGRVVGGYAWLRYHVHTPPYEREYNGKTYTVTDSYPTGWVVCVFAARDGERFGASPRDAGQGLTLEQATAIAEKKFAAQDKRYSKKFGAAQG